MKTGIVIMMIFSTIACAAPMRLDTPSGKPEVYISGASKKEVMDAIVAAMAMGGFQIRTISDYHAVFGKPSDNFLHSVFWGSKYDGVPEMRLTYTVAEVPGGVIGLPVAIRVSLSPSVVTNPGSSFERIREWNNSQDLRDLQTGLEFLKSQFQR